MSAFSPLSPPSDEVSLSLKGVLKLLFKLATRNLTRDRRRTLITGSAISLGLALFIFSDHIQQGSYQSLIRVGVSTQAGHIVVQPHAYQKDPKQEKRLTDLKALTESIHTALKEKQLGAIIVPRAHLAGLLQSPVGGARAQILAIDPLKEPQVSEWHKRLSPIPRPLGEPGEPIPSEWLKNEDHYGILLGAKLAERLDVTVGDKVVFTFNRALEEGKSEVESYLFRVRGALKLGSEEQEASTAIITLSGYQRALKTTDIAQQITLHLPQLEQLPAALELTRKVAQERSQEKIETLDWREALPTLYQFTLKDRQTSLAIFFIMGLMIAIGVLNTIAMSALERQRQLGVMMALGLTPMMMGGLLVIEGFVLGLFGSVTGVALGALFSWPVVLYGLDISSMVGEGMEVGGVVMETVIHASWHVKGMVDFGLTAIALSIAATFWPAWRTSRLSALQAMRGADASSDS